MYVLCFYIKPSIFFNIWCNWTKISSGYVNQTAFRSSHNFCNIFWIILHHTYDAAEMTALVVTYLQFENIHM